MSPAARLRIVLTIVLCAATLALFAWDGRFRVADPAILNNPTMDGGFQHWGGTPGFVGHDRDEAGAVVLIAGGQPQMTYVGQPIANPARFSRYRVSLDIRIKGIVPRAIAWQRAGVILRAFDANGGRLRNWPYLVMEAAGTDDWRRYSQIIPVPEVAASLWFVVYNAGSAGTMWIRNATIEGLAETSLGAALRYGLMAAWSALVLSAAAGLLGAGRPLLRWGLLGLGAFILAGTLAPEPGLSHLLIDSGHQAARLLDSASAMLQPEQPMPTDVTGEAEVSTGAASDASRAIDEGPDDGKGLTAKSPAGNERDGGAKNADGQPTGSPPAPPTMAERSLLEWLNGVLYDGRPILGLHADDFAHLAAYFAFAFLSVIALQGISHLKFAGYLGIAAASTEVLQSFSLTREAEALDLGFNVAGIASGLLLAVLVSQLRRKV
ncbi:MAG: hypothetical protein O3A88_04650 [Proteobacteria bacterium]|nr:hypothetical protein [Pseudomonadota bacterium]